MNRIRTTMIALLVGTALMGAGSGLAQGPRGAPLKQGDQARQSDRSTGRQMKKEEQQVWLQRLVGQYRATSSELSRTAVLCTSGTSCSGGSKQELRATRPNEGTAECRADDHGTTISCQFDLVTSNNLHKRSQLQVSMQEQGDQDQQAGGVLVGDSLTRLPWTLLEGNTATFAMKCEGTSYECRKVARITIASGDKRVQIMIGSDERSSYTDVSARSKQIDMHRQ